MAHRTEFLTVPRSLPVIGAVGCELPDPTIDLVEQRLHLRCVARVLVGHRMCNDLAAIGIQCHMQLSPTTAGSGAMLLLQPLARAVDLQSSAVDKNMHWPVRSTLEVMRLVGRLPCSRPTAQGGMIGDSERQAHQGQHRS